MYQRMKSTETSEKVFERTMSKYVESKGGMAIKLLSQFINGLPDRMYLLPGGTAIFVEFKSTGCKTRPIQCVILDRIAALDFNVRVVSNPEEYNDLKELIDFYVNGR